MLRAVQRSSRLLREAQAVSVRSRCSRLSRNVNTVLIQSKPVPYFYQSISYFSSGPPGKVDEKNTPVVSGNANTELEAKDKQPAQSYLDMTKSALKSIAAGAKDVVMNPRKTWEMIKHEAHHYWMGTKLLWSEVKITSNILARLLQGHGMTRRERRQLIRTTTDIFRLVPFAIFVIVPFMELLLPFALKLFPNMLPSTFQDSLKKEESMKKELQMRLAVAKFMQETLQEMADRKAGGAVEACNKEQESGAKDIIDFIEKTRQGLPVPTETVLRIARLFKDELTLDNISRPQLVSMCKYMNLQTYGSDTLLRFLLRTKIRNIKDDDRRILWEGVDSLNTLELREACAERGMRSLGLTQFQLKHELVQWLELSTHQNVPISLLIMSRAFTLVSSYEVSEAVLRTSLSSLDSDTINEVVIASAKGKEEDSPEIRKRKLESLKFQQEMIDEERAKVVVEPVKPGDMQEKREEKLKIEAKSSSATMEVKASINEVPRASSLAAGENSAVAPTSAMAVVKEPAKKKELTLQEVQAIVDLARGSSLQREKTELNILQSTIESVLSKQSSAANKEDNEAKKGGEEDEKASKSVERMRSALDNMLKKLEIQIVSTEKEVGDKLNVLDKDGDGELTAHELREAIVLLLRREFSLSEADQLIDLLDDDKDGKVSLSDLLHYIEKRKEALELEALNKASVAEPEIAAGSRVVS